MEKNNKKKKIKFANKEYDVSFLPHSRKEQYFDAIKNYWRDLFLIGFVLLIFALPYILLILFKGMFLSSYQLTLQEQGLTSEEITLYVTRMTVIINFIKIPCLMIFSLGLAGVARLYRLICYGEGFFFLNDFFKGIKQNFKQYIFVAFLFSFLLSLCEIIYLLLFNGSGNASQSFLISFFPLMIVILIVAPILIFVLSQVPIYAMRTHEYFTNASKYAIGNYLYSLLLVVIPFIPYFIFNLLGLNSILLSILIGILVLFFIPFYLLLVHLIAISIFDKNLNYKAHKELYLKGLAEYFIQRDK